jgi:hypothetical protein
MLLATSSSTRARAPAPRSRVSARALARSRAATATATPRRASSSIATRAGGGDIIGNPFVEGWLDLADVVSGGGDDLGVSELAEKLGKDIYMDVNGWHLFLRDAKYATPLSKIIAARLAADGNRYDEDAALQLLRECPVKIGGGKQSVKLFDLMPRVVVDDYLKIVEEYADDL